MTPSEYENYVAQIFKDKGYETEVTPLSNDYGVDVIATKGDEKIAIQAKMYGNTGRKVNRTVIMQLYGASANKDCTKAVLATDGEVMSDAIEVAKKLNIEILYTNRSVCRPLDLEETDTENNNIVDACGYPSFDEMWENYIMPLKGQTIQNSNGENKILNVDWAGIVRITSNGKRGKIAIEGFHLAYDELMRHKSVTRDWINQQYEKRCSSGIVAIMERIPFIRKENNPIKLVLK